LNFYKALIQPGESVGSISAQSLGEPTTQLTLNTFHHAGVSTKSNVNQGVPRIRELISVTKNPSTPSLTIYLKKESNSNKDFAKKVLNEIEELKFLYFVENTHIFYDNDVTMTNTGDQDFLNDYYNFYQDIELNKMSPWILKIKISDLFLLNKNSSMFELYSFLIQKYDNLHIIYSDDNSNSLFFHIRYIYDDLNKIVNDDLVTNQDLKNLKNLEQEILNLTIKGINNIKKITMREIKELKIKNNGSIDQTKKEIVLDTTGTNMEDILKIYNLLDLKKTFSNDIHEINRILGIEAARDLLKNEINNVLKFSGIYINDKHLNLLVDLITIKGTLVSIDRHGVRISDSGPLAKCSFEESDEHFIKSSLFNLNDQMKSLTSNLIMGQVGKFGTGICEVEFDIEKFERNVIK
jgi:DNA-directed RNA polymerase II subunit RPB1